MALPVDYPRSKYNWEENRKITYELTEEEKASPGITILDNRYIDYATNIKNGIDLFITRHKIIRVNDDKGIELLNKVYVPIGCDDELIQLKARTITKDGRVIEVKKENIKLLDNYEGYGDYKIFAMEGVEAGCELEYFCTIKKGPCGFSWWGNNKVYGTEIFQVRPK